MSIRRVGLRGWTVPAFTAAAICLLGAPSTASAGVSPGDRAATHTFLQASYELEVALHRDAAQANAAIGRTGAAIAAQCPKVLAGAPDATSSIQPAGKVPSPRARGEADRHLRQYTELVSELAIALHATAYQTYASALSSFAAAVTSLRWSNPVIAARVKFDLQILEAVLDPGPPPDVCGDIRAWVTSGYETLAPGTKAALSRQESFIAAAPLEGSKSPEDLVRPYEGPAERAILRRTEALGSLDIFEGDGPVTTRLHRALGIEETENSQSFSKSVSFAHGRTHTGARFEVEAANGPGSNCHLISVSVTTSGGESSSSSSAGGLRCFSGREPAAHPQVNCDERRDPDRIQHAGTDAPR